VDVQMDGDIGVNKASSECVYFQDTCLQYLYTFAKRLSVPKVRAT